MSVLSYGFKSASFAAAFTVGLLLAGCSPAPPPSAAMETTPAGSSAGQAQPARTR